MKRTTYRLTADTEPGPTPATERGSALQGAPMHGIASLVHAPWSILPAMRDPLLAIYARHVAGERADIAVIEAETGKPMANPPKAPETHPGGVAIVPIQGVIAPKMNLLMKYSGGTSAQLARRDVQAAAADPEVRGILLAIDSPGGSVLGLDELTQAVREAAAVKPVVTVSDGMLTSAAYHVGSAANRVILTSRNVMAGSIGVIAVHRDYSAAEARAGIKTTEIAAGRFKTALSPSAPLSKLGREWMQEMVDESYTRFVQDVATSRGVSVETVLTRMADAQIFIGQAALDAGLADEIASIESVIQRMATDPGQFAKRSVARIKPLDSKPSRDGGARSATSATATTKGASMADDNQGAPAAAAPALTAEGLRQSHPQVYADILAAGAKQERERISAIHAQAKAMPGHDKLIAQCIADGKSAGETAMALVAAEGAQIEAKAAAHAADAPKPVQSSPAPADKSAETPAAAAASIVHLFDSVNGGTRHG